MAGNINSGRKSKEVEQEVLEKLSVLDDLFFSKLKEAMEQGKPYAMRLFATHRIPKPQNSLEITGADETPLFNIVYNSEDNFNDTLDIDIENQLII